MSARSIHKRRLSVFSAQAREAALVAVIRRQKTTTSSSTRSDRHPGRRYRRPCKKIALLDRRAPGKATARDRWYGTDAGSAGNTIEQQELEQEQQVSLFFSVLFFFFFSLEQHKGEAPKQKSE